VDLVADGLTKPLLGQSFMSFTRDLGMRPQQREERDGGGYGTAPQIAAVSLALGSMLLSGVDSEEIGGEAEFGAIWACGATLMALGVIYAGQLTYGGIKSCTSFCLKRLQRTSRHQDEGSHQRSSEESARGNASVKLEHVGGSTPLNSSTSLSIQITTGSPDDETMAISGSLGQAASTSSLPSRGGEQAGASTFSMLSRGGEKASAAVSSSPGQAASTSSRMSRGGERTSAAAAGSLYREFLEAPKKELDLTNPWNKFQHDHAGSGLSKQTLSKMYRYHKQQKIQ